MNEEFDAFLQNHTWSLVPVTFSMNVIGNKWVYRLKYNADGTVQRHNARLVAKGFHQQPGLDYGETLSLVIKSQPIRLILSIVVARCWPTSPTLFYMVIYLKQSSWPSLKVLFTLNIHITCASFISLSMASNKPQTHGISSSVVVFFNLEFWLPKLTILSSHIANTHWNSMFSCMSMIYLLPGPP